MPDISSVCPSCAMEGEWSECASLFGYTGQILLGVRGDGYVSRLVFQSVRFCAQVKLHALQLYR